MVAGLFIARWPTHHALVTLDAIQPGLFRIVHHKVANFSHIVHKIVREMAADFLTTAARFSASNCRPLFQ